MANTSVEEKFLEFIPGKFEVEGVDALKPLIGTSQKEYSATDLVDEMRQGTKMGQRLYSSLYRLYENSQKTID